MSPHRLAVAFLAGSAGLWLAAAAATVATAGLPAEADGPVLALFAPGTDESEAVSRIVAAGGVPGEAWAGLGWTAWSSQRGFADRGGADSLDLRRVTRPPAGFPRLPLRSPARTLHTSLPMRGEDIAWVGPAARVPLPPC
jgi:hypothetical protein